MEKKEFLEKIKLAVLSVDEGAEIILFGSRARGDHKKDSDWDILIITDKGLQFQNTIRDAVYDIELDYTQAVSTIFFNRLHWNKMAITGFYENVINEGVAL